MNGELCGREFALARAFSQGPHLGCDLGEALGVCGTHDGREQPLGRGHRDADVDDAVLAHEGAHPRRV